MGVKYIMSWMDLPLKKRIKIAKKISITLKRKGIRPPSNKGKSFSKEHVNKIIEAKRKNGSLYHTPERTKKIQKARKVFYDKVGRKSKLVDRLKRTKKYRKWRIGVFERDNYTCVKCGKSGGYIEADHIIPKAYLIKLCDNNYSKCLKFKPLWSIDNGRTLCKKCHRETPTFGNGKYGNNKK